MTRNSSLFLASLALLVASPMAMHADSISFAFTTPPTEAMKASIVSIGSSSGAGGYADTAVTGNVTTVSDTSTSNVFALPGIISIAVIPIGSGVYTPQHTGSTYTGLIATYLGASSATTVTIYSALCSGGSMPGVCLAGIDNDGGYTSTVTGGVKAGTFTGTFLPTYVSPYVAGLFGDVTPATYASADDDYSTDANHFATGVSNHNLDEGFDLYGIVSGVDLNPAPSTIPEPSSLIFLGTGLLTLAGGLRMRRKDSTNSTASVTL